MAGHKLIFVFDKKKLSGNTHFDLNFRFFRYDSPLPRRQLSICLLDAIQTIILVSLEDGFLIHTRDIGRAHLRIDTQIPFRYEVITSQSYPEKLQRQGAGHRRQRMQGS